MHCLGGSGGKDGAGFWSRGKGADLGGRCGKLEYFRVDVLQSLENLCAGPAVCSGKVRLAAALAGALLCRDEGAVLWWRWRRRERRGGGGRRHRLGHGGDGRDGGGSGGSGLGHGGGAAVGDGSNVGRAAAGRHGVGLVRCLQRRRIAPATLRQSTLPVALLADLVHLGLADAKYIPSVLERLL